MRRFNVKMWSYDKNKERFEYILKLYTKDEDRLKNMVSNIISYEEIFDTTYLEYVEKIKENSIETLFDYRGREIWKIPYADKYILYRPYIQDGEYLDGGEYQRWDNIQYVNPIGFIMCEPKEFYEMFLNDKHIKLPIDVVSLNDMKKLKAKRFYNKENMAMWFDNNGYFYYADKHDLPSKKTKEEYEKFKNNPNAVYVRYGTEVAFMSNLEWYSSKEEFLDKFHQEELNHPTYLSKLYYEIKKLGYNRMNPNDYKVIFRLPYFNLQKEYDISTTKDYRHLAHSWRKRMNGSKRFPDYWNNEDWVEKLIEKYFKYIKE